jgi:hypothetical protein
MFDAWSEIYSDSAVWRSAVLYAHVGGLLLGGGCAIAADRLTILAAPGDTRQLQSIAGVHRVVLIGLALLAVSGVAMLLANFDTYIVSTVFWTKMACVALLLINGVRLTRAEQAARLGMPAAWPRLRAAAWASLALWFLTVLCGAILPNV